MRFKEFAQLDEIKKGAKDSNGFSSCWTGYHASGTKKGKNGGQVRNCVKNESLGANTHSSLEADLAKKYMELAPSIKKYKDEEGADHLYRELLAIARHHGAERKFIHMCNGARNSAHLDYDTNPGHFKNWFWYLGLGNEQGVAESGAKQAAIAIAKKASGKYTKDGKRLKEGSLSDAARHVKKGALHKQEHIPADKPIGTSRLKSLKAHGTPLEKKRANFALNIQGKG